MKSLLLALGSLVFIVVATSIDSTYESLLWKHDGHNFYAPLSLEAKAYALESPAGSAPDALSKRYEGKCFSEFLACTVVTVNGELSRPALEAEVEAYREVDDDVWSEEQVKLTRNVEAWELMLTTCSSGIVSSSRAPGHLPQWISIRSRLFLPTAPSQTSLSPMSLMSRTSSHRHRYTSSSRLCGIAMAPALSLLPTALEA